jgi:hypothetical protein
MPRKVRPKYGIDPVQEVRPFSFEPAEIELLLDALPCTTGNRDHIAAKLSRRASDYSWLRDQNQEKPTRAERNAALAEINQLARALRESLDGLDADTKSELAIALPRFDLKTILDLDERLNVLSDAAGRALQSGKATTGPQYQPQVQRTVDALAILCEEVTGKRFTHNPKEKTKYDGTPHSQAGRFISAFFAIVDPAVRAQSLSTAMDNVVRSRRATRKSGPPSNETQFAPDCDGLDTS